MYAIEDITGRNSAYSHKSSRICHIVPRDMKPYLPKFIEIGQALSSASKAKENSR